MPREWEWVSLVLGIVSEPAKLLWLIQTTLLPCKEDGKLGQASVLAWERPYWQPFKSKVLHCWHIFFSSGVHLVERDTALLHAGHYNKIP